MGITAFRDRTVMQITGDTAKKTSKPDSKNLPRYSKINDIVCGNFAK